MIYRNKTGIFQQDLFSVSNPLIPLSIPYLPQGPLLQIPTIKSVSCSVVTQTNTRMCGSVQISEFLDEFHLNCFYCCETYLLHDWRKFVRHLKIRHFHREEAFKISNYPNRDHDYTIARSPPTSPITQTIKTNTTIDGPTILRPSVPILNLTASNITPPIFNPTNTNIDIMIGKPFNVTLASKLINLLNETVLNPNYRRTDEDNIIIIKKKVFENLQSDFLNENNDESLVENNTSILFPKLTRPVYTLNNGQQNVVSGKNDPRVVIKRKATVGGLERASEDSDSDSSIMELPRRKLLAQPILNKKKKIEAKRIVQQALENIRTFENIYQTVKNRPPKVKASSGIFYIKDINSNKVTEMVCQI